MDRLSAGDALRSLNKLSEGALLAAFAGARGGDIARSLIAYENMANGDHLPKRTGIDPLAGIVLGLKKRRYEVENADSSAPLSLPVANAVCLDVAAHCERNVPTD